MVGVQVCDYLETTLEGDNLALDVFLEDSMYCI